jgi:hypothetical protein
MGCPLTPAQGPVLAVLWMPDLMSSSWGRIAAMGDGKRLKPKGPGGLAPAALLLVLSVLAVVIAASTGSWNTPQNGISWDGSPRPNATGQTTGTIDGLFAIPWPGSRRIVNLPGEVTAKGLDGDSVSVEVSEDGRFAMNLVPGTYTFTGTSPKYNHSSAECYGIRTEVVVAGGTYTEIVTCATR